MVEAEEKWSVHFLKSLMILFQAFPDTPLRLKTGGKWILIKTLQIFQFCLFSILLNALMNS
ncbi:MAG: hypothetical protein CL552_01100 [Alcanivorax sp.]|nr:hypothetical protein [Alcanivorax sp.]